MAKRKVKRLPNICGVTESLQIQGDSRWRRGIGTMDNPLTYHIRAGADLPGMMVSAMWSIFDEVLFEISTFCNLHFRRTDSASAANILATAYRHDGPSGVLADAQLANPNMKQSLQRYDVSEKRWSKDFDEGGIPFKWVAAHETGHSLGLVHDSPRANVLMAPSLSRGGWRPRDIDRLVELYGRPVEAPKPPDDGGGQHYSVTSIWVYNPTRMVLRDEIANENYKVSK